MKLQKNVSSSWFFVSMIKSEIPDLTVFVDSDEERLVCVWVPPRGWNLDVVDVRQRHFKFTVDTQKRSQDV